MIYYIHTYAHDAQLLHLCLRRLLTVDPTAHVIVANDPTCPIPDAALPQNPRIRTIATPYPCGGNLNGQAMIEGMLSTLIKIMEANHETHIVKMDCDAWINSAEWLKVGYFAPEGIPEPDYVGLERQEPLTAAGDCYRISIYAARAALRAMKARTWPKDQRLPEDRTILELVMRSQLPVHSVPYTEGKHCGMHASLPGNKERSAWVVHCGETGFDGRRVPRDFVLLRMRLMDAMFTSLKKSA